MRRREVIALMGSAAVAWPLAARSQQADAVPRIGYIFIGGSGTDVSSAGLRQGLADHGYEIGRNLILERRYADGDSERIPALIEELLALKVDVLVTVGTVTSRWAQRATTTVPVVFMSGNPVGSKLVESLSHPGGNLTGMSLMSGDYSAKWLPLLKEAAPKVRRIAALDNSESPAIQAEIEHMRQTAPAIGIELSTFSVLSADVERSLASLQTASIDGLIIPDDPFLEVLMPRVITLAAQKHLPALYGFSTAPKLGGLMSYSADFFMMWRHAAGYVDRILKGARPADLPVEQATEVSLKINLKTAKALDLTIPHTLLATADEVIE